MRRVRRRSSEPRLEIMPLIDVVFLLLTFFIFALVLMVRADLMDIRAPALQSGRPAEPGSAITVVVDAEGGLFVDGEAAAPDELIARIQDRREANPDARLFVAADEQSRSGALLDVIDRLMQAELGDFSIVGRPGAGAGPLEGGTAGGGSGNRPPPNPQ